MFLVCYSIISRSSFNNVKNKWLGELSHFAPNTPIVLLGLKSDLRNDEKVGARLAERNEKVISTSEGKQLGNEIKASRFLECSALTQENMMKVFQEAIDVVIGGESSEMNKKKKKGASCNIL